MKCFEKEVVSVMGASSGIGDAMVYVFSGEEARVIL